MSNTVYGLVDAEMVTVDIITHHTLIRLPSYTDIAVAFKLLAAFSSTGVALHLAPLHAVRINQRALLRLAKTPLAIALYQC